MKLFLIVSGANVLFFLLHLAFGATWLVLRHFISKVGTGFLLSLKQVIADGVFAAAVEEHG